MDTERMEADGTIEGGIALANQIIADLCARDGVDTRAYGLMVRKAGRMSLALHPGLHPTEMAPTDVDGKWDPRRPKAEVGLTGGGNPKASLRKAIEERHARLVELHRWADDVGGRRRRAEDMRWDPVILALLRRHGADLDAIAAAGPTDFVNPEGRRDRPGAGLTVEAPYDDGIPYIAMVDGDAVRVQQIRYAPGIFYHWSRERPDEVRLSVRGHQLPQTMMEGVLGERFSAIVGDATLDGAVVAGCSAMGKDLTARGDARLVRANDIQE